MSVWSKIFALTAIDGYFLEFYDHIEHYFTKTAFACRLHIYTCHVIQPHHAVTCKAAVVDPPDLAHAPGVGQCLRSISCLAHPPQTAEGEKKSNVSRRRQ